MLAYSIGPGWSPYDDHLVTMTKRDTFLRQWAMLRMIPRYPRKIDTRTLSIRLAEEGFSASMRTIQRDLKTLSTLFPLEEDDRNKPFGWSWAKNANVLDIPGMEPPAALVFRVAEDFLAPQLPRATLDYLQPHFRRARQVLDATSTEGFRWWADKVRIVPRGLPLIPAEVDGRVQYAVYQALFEGRRLRVVYRPRDCDANVEYEVNPLGLVFRQGVVYLVATLWEYADVKQLALHRIQDAELMDKKAKVPPGFDLDNYIGRGEFEYPVSSKPLRLRLLFDGDAAFHLQETPLAKDQVLKSLPDGRVEVRATVKDTLELRWWLQGFGEYVEILGPAALRKEFQVTARNLHRMYNSHSRRPD